MADKEILEQAVKRIAKAYANGVALFFGDETLEPEFMSHIQPALREMAEWVYRDAANEILFSDEGEIGIAASFERKAEEAKR